MKPRFAFFALATAALFALRVAPAGAGAALAPLLPLDPGNRWEYQNSPGARAVEAITGARTILGRSVAVKSYLEGPDAGLENWWLTGPNDEVLLAGFDRPADAFSLAYDPPIAICGGAPTLGDAWTTHVVAYSLPSMAVYAEMDITFRVLEDVSLAVPAGTFPCFGVGQVLLANSANGAARKLTLDGRLAPGAKTAAATNATEWFSRGVGVVQYGFGPEPFQLTHFGNPTPARASTWGLLKQMYR